MLPNLKSLLPKLNFFPEIERNISFSGACSQNEKYALLKLKFSSCFEKNGFYFGSMLPKWKSCAPDLKIFLLNLKCWFLI